MADNRVVIKINYDTDKRKQVLDPKIVTVWHTKRILAAVALLGLIIVLLFWLLSTDSQDTDVKSQPMTPIEIGAAALPEKNLQSEALSLPIQSAAQSPIKNVVLNKGTAIILDKHVIRASLNISIKDNEPGKSLQSAIILEPGKTQELYYFSETKHAKDIVLFHHWLKDGVLLHKKQVDKQNTKFVSRHIVSQKDIGHWNVVLIDKKGKIYSQVEFNVGLQ
jgi:hypothetical protein